MGRKRKSPARWLGSGKQKARLDRRALHAEKPQSNVKFIDQDRSCQLSSRKAQPSANLA